MFELWRPSYGMTPTIYAKSWVKPYYESHNITKKMAGDECGIENYCVGKNTQPENDRQEKMVNDLSPLLPEHLLAEHDFVVHSFEPSNQLFEMHQQFGQNPAPEYLNLKSHWQWHKIAAADLDGDVFFDSLWNEGSSIAINKGVPNTRAAKLDTLAYGSEQMFRDRIIDVLKIDAEVRQFPQYRLCIECVWLITACVHAIHSIYFQTPRMPCCMLRCHDLPFYISCSCQFCVFCRGMSCRGLPLCC
jgi:hypothetical protein